MTPLSILRSVQIIFLELLLLGHSPARFVTKANQYHTPDRLAYTRELVPEHLKFASLSQNAIIRGNKQVRSYDLYQR